MRVLVLLVPGFERSLQDTHALILELYANAFRIHHRDILCLERSGKRKRQSCQYRKHHGSPMHKSSSTDCGPERGILHHEIVTLLDNCVKEASINGPRTSHRANRAL